MIPRSNLYKLLRRLHWLRARDPIDENVRGWNWDKPPLRPRAYLGLGVSEIASRYCETMRDIWLRRVENIQPKITEPMRRGLVIHQVIHLAIQDVLRELINGKTPWDAYEYLCTRAHKKLRNLNIHEKWALNLYKMIIMKWLSESSNGSIPLLLTEHIVDGSQLGLSRYLRIDALAEGGVVIEFKYGSWRDHYRAVLAGYALALESYIETPIDYGLIILINDLDSKIPTIRIEPIYIDTDARMDFIEYRDEAIDMLISGNEPPKSSTCSPNCPFREVCTD